MAKPNAKMDLTPRLRLAAAMPVRSSFSLPWSVILAGGLALIASGCSALPTPSAAYGPAAILARIDDPELTEISGLTPSRRAAGGYWVNNDSGDAPRLFALDEDGRRLGTLHIDGVEARDWEDIASFEYDGRAWLLIADTGDNYSQRDDVRLHLLPEPDPADFAVQSSLHLRPTVTLRFSYEDGPRDCEGVTVSPVTGEILLLSKRTTPPVLYTLPLQLEAGAAPLVARRIAPAAGIVPPTAAERALPGRLGEFRSQVTALDLSTDGSRLAALTYGNIWVYRREPGETWAATLARNPERIPVTGLPQAEALCFPPNSHDLMVTTEHTHAPLQRYQAR